MFCVNCGSYEPSGGPYCTQCGFRLDTIGATITETPQARQAANAPTTAFTPATDIAPDPLGAGYPVAGPYARPHRRRHGCAVGCLVTLLVVAAALAATWTFALQPALRSFASHSLQGNLAQMVEQTPPLPAQPAAQVTAWRLVLRPEDVTHTLDNALGPAVQANTTFVPDQMQVTLRGFGLSSTVSAVLRVSNGQLVLRDVNVTGPLSWVLPGQTIQADFNQALAALLAREHLRAISVTTRPTQIIAYFQPAS